MAGPVKKMPVPFMGPPLLIDKKTDFCHRSDAGHPLHIWARHWTSCPNHRRCAHLAIKTVNDANDVIDEITLNGGEKMWTDKRWKEFVPRLKKWMSFWEEIGRRHGLTKTSGFLLGSDAPGIADVVTATPGTMGDRFPKIAAMLKRTAPMTAALTELMGALPALAKPRPKRRKIMVMPIAAERSNSRCGRF